MRRAFGGQGSKRCPCLNGAAGSGLGGTDGGVDLCGQACGVVDREVEVCEALVLQGDDQGVLVTGDVPELRGAVGVEGPGELAAGLQSGPAPALGLVAQAGDSSREVKDQILSSPCGSTLKVVSVMVTVLRLMMSAPLAGRSVGWK